MPKLNTLLLVILTAISINTNAQDFGKITGKVNSTQNLPIQRASVLLKKINQGTQTGSDGSFTLQKIPFGVYRLYISAVGYVPIEQEVTINKTSHLNLQITLQESNQQLQEVSVDGKTANQKVKESGYSVNAIETKQFANLNLDINQILSRSLGVNVRESAGLGSDFKFSINGLSGKQVRFFIDGVPMENFGSSMTLNNFPVNLIERIEVFKGVVPTYLGSDALGGAVNIITNQSAQNIVDASLSYGSFNTLRGAILGRWADPKTGLIINLSGFHNSSDNDYMMRNNPKYGAPIKYTEGENIIERDARRFHDRYRSDMGQIDIGLEKKKWADLMSVGLTYSNLYREIQTGASQNQVYGGLHNRSNFLMPTLKYKKDNFIIPGLHANLFSSFAIDNSSVIDTANQSYDWGGATGRPLAIAGELNDVKTIYHYKNKTGVVKANLNYEFNENNAINLNYNYSHFQRSAKEDLKESKLNPFSEPNTINKNVIGLSYQNVALDRKLTTSVFGKMYQYQALTRDVVYFSDGGIYVAQDSTIANKYFGYGIATRYSLSPAVGIKASYEHAYRLQEGDEMFGNGIDQLANLKLKPENSNNFNIGTYYSKDFARHHLALEIGYFRRDANDFISIMPSGGKFSSYENTAKVLVNGFEGEIRYRYGDFLDASVNASYQKAVNKSKYIDGNPNNPDKTYNDRMRNQPWLYGNGNLSLYKNNWLGSNTKTQFIWSTQYTHWYYLDWESLGSKESKDRIPTQLVHNAALSHSLKNDKYNISLECRNLTNELAYDNFRLQKPGRSFHLKLRYFIHYYNNK